MYTRRKFIQHAGLAAGGILIGGCSGMSSMLKTGADQEAKEIPLRVLGRTREKVTCLGMGTSPAGWCRYLTAQDIARLVKTALDNGIRYFDTAHRYGFGKAEEGVGLGLEGHRKEVFLTGKVLADSIQEAETSLNESMKLLKTDYLDLVYFHNLGTRDMGKALKSDGVFGWLVKQKRAGRFRFLGISGHNLPGRFKRFIITNQVDVMMCVINYADRYTYGFEEEVLPIARKYDVGIVAMKVFGGIRPGDRLEYLSGPPSPPAIEEQNLDLALRYALSVPGVAVANIGVYHDDEIRWNAGAVKNFKPLSEEESGRLSQLGKNQSFQWGEHFGPVKENRVD